MDNPSPALRNLAAQLLAERLGATRADPSEHEAVALCETLRISMTKFAGADGFSALLRRALVLAGAEAPALKQVKLGPDCHMTGLEGVDTDAAISLAAHLLALLVTFIGEPLTLRLVREAWRDPKLHL
jgi:hypothetical protein